MAFHAVFQKFLVKLSEVDGLEPDDLTYLVSETRARLNSIVQIAKDLSSHNADNATSSSRSKAHASTSRDVVDAPESDHAGRRSRLAATAPAATAAGAGEDALTASQLAELEALIAEKIRSHTDSEGMKHLFLHFDIDSSGKLGPQEFRRAINELGIYLSNAELSAILAHYDVDGSNTIDYLEFLRVVEESHWASVAHSSYVGLDKSHIPHNPDSFDIKTPKEIVLSRLAGRIVSKIRQHYSSARELYMSATHRADRNRLRLDDLRRHLATIGFPVSAQDLQDVTAPYCRRDPGRSLSLSELQTFMDANIDPDFYATAAPDHDDDEPAFGSASASPELLGFMDTFHGLEDSLLLTFKRYDHDNDGYLSLDEFRTALAVKGFRVNESCCKRILDDLGVSGSPIYYEFVVDTLRTYSPIEAQFTRRPYDPPKRIPAPVAAAAAASARRRGSIASSVGSAARSRPSSAPASASPSPARVSVDLVRRIADAVYSSSHSVRSLYKKMATKQGVSPTGLVHGMHRIGCILSPEEAKSLVAAYDVDGLGFLSHADFVKMLADA